MKFLFTITLGIFLFSCTKESKTEQNCWPFEDKWLTQLKKEHSSCVCLTAFYSGTYQGQPVLEVRTIDPACNSVHIVYKMDGTPRFNSGDPSAYKQYIDQVQELREVWRCASGGK